MRNATICVPPWGIAGAHWDIIRGVAAAKRHIYVIRSGKARAIPWIEKNFPGKPRELSAFKVNPTTGLLEAPRDRWSLVFAAGHLVLDQAGGGNWKLVSGRGSAHQTTEAPARIDTWRRHAKPGLVIQRESRLPFTSDYDLGAVLDTTDHRWGKSFMSVHRGGPGTGSAATGNPPPVATGAMTSEEMAAVRDYRKGLGVNWSNRYIDQSINALNAALARHGHAPRFLHGPVSNFFGSPAMDTNDCLLVFYPDRPVEVVQGLRSLAQAHQLLMDILHECAPHSR